jgi:hypothetical protein
LLKLRRQAQPTAGNSSGSTATSSDGEGASVIGAGRGDWSLVMDSSPHISGIDIK